MDPFSKVNARGKQAPTSRLQKMEIIPLGSGAEVGRSCHILRYKGKTVMLDCGMHPGYSGAGALPFFDEVDPGEIDLLLDCDNGILRVGIVGKKRLIKDNENIEEYIKDANKSILENEARLWNLQIGDECKGWVPHIALWSDGAQCRVAKIDPTLFGVEIEDCFTSQT